MSLTLASTTTIVASLPALLGFIPDDSLVLITALTNDDGTVTTGPLTRIALTHLTGHADDCVQQFNRQCGDLPVLCVTGIVVCTVDEDNAGDDLLPLCADVDTVVTKLADHGFTDVDVVHVPAVAEGARWRSYRDTDRTGVLPDPAATAAAAAAVAAGHTIAASREDLAARFTPAPECLRARLQPRIADAVESAVIDECWHLAAYARLARADAAIRAASHGELPDDDAVIVGDPPRDPERQHRRSPHPAQRARDRPGMTPTPATPLAGVPSERGSSPQTEHLPHVLGIVVGDGATAGGCHRRWPRPARRVVDRPKVSTPRPGAVRPRSPARSARVNQPPHPDELRCRSSCPLVHAGRMSQGRGRRLTATPGRRVLRLRRVPHPNEHQGGHHGRRHHPHHHRQPHRRP
jgi:uncharacterized protein DUF4192